MKDMVGCCSLERAPAAVDAALQCIIQMTAAPALQVPKPLPFAPYCCHVSLMTAAFLIPIVPSCHTAGSTL